MTIFDCPLLVLKEIDHYWKYGYFSKGLKQIAGLFLGGYPHLPSHRREWKSTDPCRKTTLFLERALRTSMLVAGRVFALQTRSVHLSARRFLVRGGGGGVRPQHLIGV